MVSRSRDLKTYIMKKFSLILPVYNVERYLSKCLNSCISQNIPSTEYEIIVVIDGSPDNSLNIALTYKKKYNNIIIVEKTNGGLSDARNMGLKIATGEYVWFIDSDDYIESNILYDIYKEFKSDSLDCIWIKWRNVDENDCLIPFYERVINNEMTNTMTGYLFMENVLETYLPAWSFIYKREFLLTNKLQFSEGMYYEDADFAYRSIPLLNRIKLYNNVCYNYLYREGSIISNTNMDKFIDICNNAQTAYLFYKKYKINNMKLSLFYYKSYSAFFLFAIKYYLRNRNNDILVVISELIEKELFMSIYPWGRFYNKMLAFLYNIIGPKCMIRLLKLIVK